MEILHIITRLDPGGSSYICKIMVRELRKKGINCFLATGKNDHSATAEMVINHLRRDINLFYDVLAVFEMWQLIKKLRPDILHLHTSKAGFIGRIAGKLAGVKKIIYQPHGHIFYGYFGAFKSRLILYIERLMASFTDIIIVLTKSCREDFLRYKVGNRSQYKVIENAIEIEKYKSFNDAEKSKLKTELGISSEDDRSPLVIGMVGRLVELKGHIYFIEAFEKLLYNNENVRGVIIGSGDYENHIKLVLRDKKLEEKIILMGYVENIPEIIGVLDILIQPSLIEGFGLSIIEAGASEIPTIGSNIGGIKEIIKDGKTGYLVPVMDSDAIFKKISYLLQNPALLVNMGENAGKYVKSRYNIEALTEKLYKIYKNGKEI